jgi:hypothetical protein
MSEADSPNRQIETTSIGNLKCGLKSLVREASEALSGKTMPMRRWFRIEHAGKNAVSFPQELRPNVPEIQMAIFRVWDKLETPKRLRDLIEDDAQLSKLCFVHRDGSPMLDVAPKESTVLNDIAVPFVVAYFMMKKDFTFDEALCEIALDQFTSPLQNPVNRFRSTTPLLNLRIDVESIDLAPEIRLRALSPCEVENLLNYSTNLPLVSTPIPIPSSWRDLQCALEISAEAAKKDRDRVTIVP